MEKNKKLIVLGVIALILIVSGITYAILTWTSSRINIGLTSNCFTIDYTKGQDITNQSIKLINEEDLISDGKFTIKEGIALTYANIGIKSTCNIEGYGILKLNVTSLSDAFTTGSSKGSLKYAVLKNTSTASTITVASLLNQSFDLVSRGRITKLGTIDILTKQLSNTEIYKYLIVVYIDNSLVSNDVIGSSFAGNISAEAYQGKLGADYTLQRLNSLNSSIKVDTSKTPDFTTVSGNNGVKYVNDSQTATGLGDGTKGIYKAEDDFGTSYYFRGAVDNNYVKFVGYYWRIIRINGDGSIRMIYDGTIRGSDYNTDFQDNGYVGYMYGNFTTPTNCNTDDNTGVTTCTGGSTSYEEAHANINDSGIKAYIDYWYNNKLKDYAYAIEDTIYCNDRSITPVDSFLNIALTGTGKGIENTAYSNLKRNYIDHTPSLKCVNKNDRFTVNNNIGNAKLTNPIALITSDEVIMAGALTYNFIDNSYIRNTDFYLYNDNEYWTLTPFAALGGVTCVAVVSRGGFLGVGDGGGSSAVRPVVSLKSDAISGGSGTRNDPWIVESWAIPLA